jgi:hypothetical protein
MGGLDTPLGDFEPFYSSPLSQLLFTISLVQYLPAMLSTRLIALCCNQTPKNWKLETCPFTTPSVYWITEVAAGALIMGFPPPRRQACGEDDMGLAKLITSRVPDFALVVNVPDLLIDLLR